MFFLSDINIEFTRNKGSKDKGKRVMRGGRSWIPNKPVPSDRPGKKKMVLASKKINGETKYKLIHYGASAYGNNYSSKARKNYLARSGGIKNKSGGLTKDDKFSPNFWARRDLWSKNSTPVGTGRFANKK